MAEPDQVFQTVDRVQNELARQNYVADRALALTVKLSNDLKKPILLEGEAGVFEVVFGPLQGDFLAGAVEDLVLVLQLHVAGEVEEIGAAVR